MILDPSWLVCEGLCAVFCFGFCAGLICGGGGLASYFPCYHILLWHMLRLYLERDINHTCDFQLLMNQKVLETAT